mmetsp:Transcript_11595/g.23229  ORF Transcript_11595/g.23229 Transcript_11595/m.23229 type:complete len:185 (-) Transcript_11595:932-1486(-)
MTDEDFAEMVLSRARMNKPIPPLQQRKLRVLLNWVRSIQIETNSCDTSSPPPNASEGFEVGKSNTARYKVSVRKDDISYIPNDWEDKFYRDLPRLKKELKQMGGESTFRTGLMAIYLCAGSFAEIEFFHHFHCMCPSCAHVMHSTSKQQITLFKYLAIIFLFWFWYLYHVVSLAPVILMPTSGK